MSELPSITPPPPEPQGSLPPPAPPAAPQAEGPLCDGWDVALILTAAIFLFFFLIPIVLATAFYVSRGALNPAELGTNPRIFVPAQAAGYVVLLFFMGVLVRLRHNARFWEGIRWRWPAGLAWVGFLAGGVALAIAIQVATLKLPVPPSLPIDKFFRDATSAWLLAGFGILVAPPVEELFYRGFLYPVLARPLGTPAAVVLTSIPFALMHASQLGSAWAPLLMLFLVSVALTLTRAKSGSVAASVLMHMAYNTTLFTMLFFATDHFRHLEKAL